MYNEERFTQTTKQPNHQTTKPPNDQTTKRPNHQTTKRLNISIKPGMKHTKHNMKQM
jgi:hypothetical protein